VTFSVDPEHDTPDKLAVYSQRYHASPERWSFLTGARSTLEEVILRGLKVHMTKGDGEGADDIMSIGHGGHFALVDAAGQIRGYYDSVDSDAVDRLLRDAALLVNDAG
jgi:protein SCO1/2